MAAWSLMVASLSVGFSHVVAAAEPAQSPLFMSQPVRPLAMLNMSNDHQLFFKLYDDYSDVDEDGIPDNTYVHSLSYPYYGYFASDVCYTYRNARFEPTSEADGDGYCNQGGSGSEWSGNFLNWATMTRMDAVRKILYGGLRSTDTEDETVLERAFLPNDAHSFTKYYNGADVARLTPFSVTTGLENTAATGITFCNTTDPSNRSQLSQNVDSAPLLKVVEGNYSLWASNERWQCRWGENVSGNQGKNGNDPSRSGIHAYSDSPNKADVSLGLSDYNVRVKTCDKEYDRGDCKSYNGSWKPVGLLQEKGDNDSVHFGLMTGSYGKNKSGGVLRKNIGSIKDEINPENGVFVDPGEAEGESVGSIIQTLDKLRIYGYRFDNGTYHGTSGSDNCIWARSSFDDGDCTNWGNPQSEIYLESLRYLVGLDPTPAYNVDDSDRIEGLNTASWNDPIGEDNYCAPVGVIQFNASTSSYDGLGAGAATDIGLPNVHTATKEVGDLEGITGNQYFVGEVLDSEKKDAQDQLCTAKLVNSLAKVRGTCPDAPRLEGSYHIAGLASYARTEALPISSLATTRTEPVTTYGVALAPAVPSVTVLVPGTENQTINIQPACRDRRLSPQGNCAIVDFKIIEQDETGTGDNVTQRSGSLYVNWEDSEQGGDFDQDMWGVIDYTLTADELSVRTEVMAQSSGGQMGFGYILSGTEEEGFKVHAGINNYTYGTSCTLQPNGHTNCSCRYSGEQGQCNTDLSRTRTDNEVVYDIKNSSAEPLRQPLYYAAKWGGYKDDSATDTAIRDSDAENYYFARDPVELKVSLGEAIDDLVSGVGTASAVATNSTRLQEGGYIYQALFDSDDWSGAIRAFEVQQDVVISDEAAFSTDSRMQTSNAGRDLYTYSPDDGGKLTDFTWGSLSDTQKTLLMDGDGEAVGVNRSLWLAGDRSLEGQEEFRERERLLGDVVNSSPVYLGGRDYGYSLLPDDQGGDEYADFVEYKSTQTPTLFVGANDGMLHAFYAEGPQALSERFAYVPNGVYSKLAKLVDPDYGLAHLTHEYTVDGPLAVGDAYVNGEWKSVLVGTLGAGGKSVFALDVTSPDDPKLLFELSVSELSAKGELGYVMEPPQIARMANGRWAMVFGNGADAGASQLFVIDLEDPLSSYTRVIDTEAGAGLSGVALLGDAFGEIYKAYAGDLSGNMWVFDLSGTNQDGWDVGLGGQPLFEARDAGGNAQPITGSPTLGFNSHKKHVSETSDGVIMVYFGTGKYFDVDDNVPGASEHVNSFYAIADLGTPITYTVGGRANVLHDKHMSVSDGTRKVSGEGEDGPDWENGSVNGWFMDLDLITGERVVNKPLLMFDRLIFATVIPSQEACKRGGESWLMELEAIGDRYVDKTLLDENKWFEDLIPGDLTSTLVDDKEGKLLINTSGGEEKEEKDLKPDEEDLNIPGDALGRQSWRQLQ
ncbi:pilus assembly protein [Marinimicrobium locisalis]|uniref:pilus assembly protein n=1 Tax=Marinimicrobium locisalis TaxID=546022 RepID=UPI0032220AC8